MKTPPEGGALEHRQMGSNWTYRTSLATPFGGYPSWWGIVWSGSWFTAVGSNGTVADSVDGISWRGDSRSHGL